MPCMRKKDTDSLMTDDLNIFYFVCIHDIMYKYCVYTYFFIERLYYEFEKI